MGQFGRNVERQMGSVSSLTGGSLTTHSYYILSTGKTGLCNEVAKDPQKETWFPKRSSADILRGLLCRCHLRVTKRVGIFRNALKQRFCDFVALIVTFQ
jgi:hypothetical protein